LIGHLNLLGSKATYLRTGINYSRFDIEPNSILFNIPFQLEYIYPKGLFRPRIAYGLNLYIPTGLTIVATNFGGNLRISENIFITINSEIQFGTRTLFLPTGVFSYSLQLGLYKSLN